MYSLRDGGITEVSRRESTHALSKAVICALVGSSYNECSVEVLKTPFEAYASFQSLADGTALWWISAGRALGQDRVPRGARLYTCTMAAELANAPIAWRQILQGYVREVVLTNLLSSVNAPGLMPKRTLPWGVGYLTEHGTKLTTPESKELHTVIAIAAGYIATRCVEGSAASIQSGRVRELDPERFPELQDW